MRHDSQAIRAAEGAPVKQYQMVGTSWGKTDRVSCSAYVAMSKTSQADKEGKNMNLLSRVCLRRESVWNMCVSRHEHHRSVCSGGGRGRAQRVLCMRVDVHRLHRQRRCMYGVLSDRIYFSSSVDYNAHTVFVC